MTSDRYSIFLYLIFGSIFFVLFHFESLSIGSIKISHLWKSSVLFFLVIGVIIRIRVKLYIYRPLLVLAFMQLFSPEILNDPKNAVQMFAMLLLIPIYGIYVMKFSYKQLQSGLFFISSFFTLVFVPYQVGILESIQDGYNLENYGVQVSGLIGPFQNVHGASIALATAFILNVYFWFEGTINRNLLLLYLALGFYFLINTYVRTGLVMVAFGLLPMLFYYLKRSSVSRARLALIAIVLGIFSAVFLAKNHVMLDRFSGSSTRHSEDKIENLGSGRGLIYITHIQIFMDASLFEKVIGMGQKELRDRTAVVTGSRSLSHNGFIQTLLTNGVLGLIFLLLSFKNLYELRKYLESRDYVLINSFFFAYFVMSFFQNFDVFYFHVGLMTAVAFVVGKSKEQRTNAVSI